jgi:hypothetical protein
VLRKTFRTVANDDGHAFGEVFACLTGEFLLSLDGVDVFRTDDFGDNGGVVAASRPDFERLVALGKFEAFGYHSHHVWCAYRLSLTDRKGGVLVDAPACVVRDEVLAPDGPHRTFDGVRLDVSAFEK